jgi:long-chain acyl-CoA synthetase
MKGNLATLLTDAAATHPSRTALLHGSERTGYAELESRSARLAGMLRACGVSPGDRVGIVLPNEPSFVEAYYATLRLGAIAVPLNPLLKPPELRLRLEHAGAKAIVVRGSDGEALGNLPGATRLDPAGALGADPFARVVDREGADTAVILYTSGTTGEARGAELTHGGLRAKALFLAGPLLRLTPEDVVLGAAPLSHVLGQSGVMNPAILAGACVALMPRFEAGPALDLMRRTRTTVLLGVPTMCIALLQAAGSTGDLPPLRVVHAGGASLAPDTLRAFTTRFGCEVLEGYGMTETAGTISTHRVGQRVKPGSVGTAADGMELRLVDERGADVARGEVGEVLLRGPGLMKGYWRNPEATAAALFEDGWFATGDMGYLDEDGYLFLVDRKKDVILRGGYTVYPRELEDVLSSHPDVLEGVALGVPDPSLGEEVVAVVVGRPGSACDPDEIREFVRERVATYKYPRLVVVAERLPHSPSGKILRREIDRGPLRTALDERLASAQAGSRHGEGRTS